VKPFFASAAALLGLVLAPAALGQVPTTTTTPAPPPPPPPAPAPTPPAANISVSITSGISDRRHLYVIAGQPLAVRGTVSPFVAGQRVDVTLYRGHKRVGRRHVNLHAGGRFAVALRAPGNGTYAIQVTHAQTAAQAAGKSPRVGFSTLDGNARIGSSGENVRLLQRGLAGLAYVTSRGGGFDDTTGRAVLAFRKVNGMSRNESANGQVFAMVFAGRGGFKLRYPHAGKHVEFDWSRQVVVLADHGHAERIYHASSGKPSTPTVFGAFSFYSKTPGTNAKGMVDSNYFIGGYAIHGYPEVPTYAASHGCIRVPIPNAASIFAWIQLGDKIFVYR
jgi:hypothetical protein